MVAYQMPYYEEQASHPSGSHQADTLQSLHQGTGEAVELAKDLEDRALYLGLTVACLSSASRMASRCVQWLESRESNLRMASCSIVRSC
jgi:hypothetical protein